IFKLFFQRRRATVHESLKHPWICFNEESTSSNEQTINSLDEEDEEEEAVVEEIDELTNETNVQNFN
ncbi:unnamed protein product, partial [Rotaria magnacalcarata]